MKLILDLATVAQLATMIRENGSPDNLANGMATIILDLETYSGGGHLYIMSARTPLQSEEEADRLVCTTAARNWKA